MMLVCFPSKIFDHKTRRVMLHNFLAGGETRQEIELEYLAELDTINEKHPDKLSGRFSFYTALLKHCIIKECFQLKQLQKTVSRTNIRQ
jgi:hypothetical protein